MIPYGRQSIDESDIEAVIEVLRSAWLTTGPKVGELEAAVGTACGAAHGVAVNSGTAALHCAMHALGVGPGDEVIVPAMTFAATANSVLFQGGRPVFADVDPETLLIDPAGIEERITARTKAVVVVDYAGQPCDYDVLTELTRRRGLRLVADACHSLGGDWRGRPVGSLAEISVFSFHPVKQITTGEGGMAVTDDPELARRMRLLRNHGISTDFRERERQGSWHYEMVDLGFNYRLTDIQCALGVSQLARLPGFVARRREIAARYDRAFADMAGLSPLGRLAGSGHAHHLYVVRLDPDHLAERGRDRGTVFSALRAAGIGVNVHYIPVHLHPYYREKLGTGEGLCPKAEEAYERILTLPLHQGLNEGEIERVIAAVGEALA